MIKNSPEPLLMVESKLRDLLEYGLRIESNLHSFSFEELKNKNNWFDKDRHLERSLTCAIQNIREVIAHTEEQLYNTQKMRQLLIDFAKKILLTAKILIVRPSDIILRDGVSILKTCVLNVTDISNYVTARSKPYSFATICSKEFADFCLNEEQELFLKMQNYEKNIYNEIVEQTKNWKLKVIRIEDWDSSIYNIGVLKSIHRIRYNNNRMSSVRSKEKYN